MRTLSRPMFNMGGPIKQGIMHGIREPYAGGSRAGLVGNPVYPRTGGREHHVVNIPIMGGIAGARWLATLGARKLAQKAAQKTFQKAGQTIGSGAMGTSGSASNVGKQLMNIKQPPAGWGQKLKGWFTGDPLYTTIAGGTTMGGRAAKWLGKKGYGAAKYGLTTPSGLALTAAGTYGFWPDGTPKEPPTGIMKPGGYPDADAPIVEEVKKLSEAERKAFANKQREERVNKYLDIMGYDRSKKMAIADALIDASRIVGERGTLDPKNITQELINPIIQATSKRLDKPQQIREAVGLMATKAEIEKDLSKEKDALKTTLTKLQIENAENTLAASKSFEGGLGEFLSTRKGAVAKNELTQMARLLADKHGDSFTVVDAATEIPEGGSGIYMIDSNIFRVTDGVPKQLV